MWTLQNKKRGFMVVTTHFIDDFWRLQSRVMRYIFYLNSFQILYELISLLVIII